ncbi:hypothetical protein ARMGADRAFT_759715 [Armillaria gallica]|uniref:F-box domain-containing protein n=1 Tax=Armillaria gallica TaxID=47427 RepID=A0A2H3DZ75_ARMGA|nr:hypothetical protein ARMGADRAFT_759715 [Armillaria gallica]
MPVDIALSVFELLNVLDLLHLTYLSETFRHALMSKDSQRLFRELGFCFSGSFLGHLKNTGTFFVTRQSPNLSLFLNVSEPKRAHPHSDSPMFFRRRFVGWYPMTFYGTLESVVLMNLVWSGKMRAICSPAHTEHCSRSSSDTLARGHM